MPHKDPDKRKASNRASCANYQRSEKGKANRRQYRASLKYQLADRAYKSSPRALFLDQKRNAKGRGIPFFLTFAEWWSVWEQSGHWEQRGCHQGEYVMSRPGDDAVGNVRIVQVEANIREMNDRRVARSGDSIPVS
jgi:hypothetical protein